MDFRKIHDSYVKIIVFENRLDDEIKELKKLLKPLIKFEFDITNTTDGFCLLDENSNQSLLPECLGVIQEKGTLMHEDFEKYGI